jgi:hypothetical protein
MMINRRNRLIGTAVMFAGASLASVALTSYASAQCAECSEYNNRDPFTQGLTTSSTPGGAVAPRSPYNSRAEMRGYRQRHMGNTYYHSQR